MTANLTVTTEVNQDPPPIVVGVDGSAASLAALRWAGAEATARGAPLVALYVHDPRNHERAPYAPADARDADSEDRSAAIEKLIENSPTSSVGRVFEVGVPSEILVRRATGARMLVLGHAEQHRRHDGEPFRYEPVLGTVARACAAQAMCPVVLVPVPAQGPAPADADPTPRLIPEPAGVRTVHPHVHTTSVAP